MQYVCIISFHVCINAYITTGHEDIRQDERVMQFFGFVNVLFDEDREAAKQHLRIQRFSVSPLSPNSGLIGTFT